MPFPPGVEDDGLGWRIFQLVLPKGSKYIRKYSRVIAFGATGKRSFSMGQHHL